MKTQAASLVLLAAGLAPGGLVWHEAAPLLHPQGGGAAGLLGDDFVIAGGNAWQNGKKLWYREVQIYNTRNGRWRAGPSLPLPVAEAAFVASSLGLDVLGGSDGSHAHSKHWRLAADKTGWKELGSLPQARMYGAALRLGSSIYLLGGATDEDLAHATDSVLALDESGASPDWKNLEPIPGGGRALHAAAAARGRLFVFGGCYGKADGTLWNLGDAYSYDPARRGWRKLRDLPRPMRMISAAVFDDRYVYLFGGYFATAEEASPKPQDFGFSSDVLVYDIALDQYRQVPTSMPLRVAGPLVGQWGKAFYIAGGEDRNYSRSGRLWVGEISSRQSVVR